MRISVSLGTSFLVLNSVVVGIINAAPSGRVLSTSVCELVSVPRKFHDRIIRVSAEVNSDGIERTVIFSDKCPDKGVSLIVPPKVAGTGGAIALRNAIYSGRPGTTGKHISATFTGRFLWRPKEVPSRMLVLQDVKNIKVD